MILYTMQRGYKDVAQVVTLDSGKCIVSWPTSVVVYDSEDAARAVHIDHMGGRGEPTTFRPVWSPCASFRRGMDNASIDVMEGCWYASLTNNYESDEPAAYGDHVESAEGYIAGYAAYMKCFSPKPWREHMAEWVASQKAERARRQLSSAGLQLAERSP